MTREFEAPVAEEAMIVRNWPLDQAPLVSVICITYNHESVIEDALRGFLIQVTSFPFEVLIHDDASCDKTPEIVKAYEERYPRVFKTICQYENQFSKGLRIIPPILAKAKGKYIAFCEGDDYWVDPDKLNRQVAVLEENYGLDMCWHNCSVLDSQTGKRSLRKFHPTNEGFVQVADVIENDGGFIPTSSLMVRRAAVEKMPDWFHSYAPISDFFYQIYAARRGGGICIHDAMGVYRANHAGSWTSRTWRYPEKRLQFERAFHRCLDCAESDFSGLSRSFSRLIFRHYTLLGLFGMRAHSREIFVFSQGVVLARISDLRLWEKLVASVVFWRGWSILLR
jgi:glycosyltransferase involved in cell wall biosynthesis